VRAQGGSDGASTVVDLLAELGCTTGCIADVLNHVRVPAYVFDEDGRFRWVNAVALELFGDLVGRRFVHTVVPEHVPLAREQVARKLVGGTPTDFDLVVFDRDRLRMPLRISSVPLRAQGRIVGVFGVAVPHFFAPAAGGARASEDKAAALTARQHEVLVLLNEGLGTNEIAGQLGISDETARNHIRAVLRELGAHSRLEAVVVAHRLGLLGPHN
jgi:DNA-binding CsgD family transcriptional regulator